MTRSMLLRIHRSWNTAAATPGCVVLQRLHLRDILSFAHPYSRDLLPRHYSGISPPVAAFVLIFAAPELLLPGFIRDMRGTRGTFPYKARRWTRHYAAGITCA